ncbi:MAG TPA: hypothetical protein PLQ80_02950 [Candidatus Syntrophosphaera sp.]|nr:hypothetical protein [Candidatus Syntrophosphaera sp.]HPH60600.1 hypothetical protein [Candidatus Syntrophosphaera sp.]
MNKALLILSVFLAAAAAAGGEKISLAQYYPWWSQLRWDYRTQEGDKTFTQVVTCILPKDSKKAGWDFYLDTRSVRHTKYYYKVDGDWIYLVRIDVKSNLFPIPLTFHVKPRMPAFPLKINDVNTFNWHWEGKYTSVLVKKTFTADFKMKRNVPVDTYKGTMTGLKLYATYTDGDTVDHLESWHVKDLGLVYFSGPNHFKHLFKIKT